MTIEQYDIAVMMLSDFVEMLFPVHIAVFNKTMEMAMEMEYNTQAAINGWE